MREIALRIIGLCGPNGKYKSMVISQATGKRISFDAASGVIDRLIADGAVEQIGKKIKATPDAESIILSNYFYSYIIDSPFIELPSFVDRVVLPGKWDIYFNEETGNIEATRINDLG